ncbi:hypothetical protein [Winogradskyella psychrotolerans]|uniref:hypothetical protein n=1 Tax=Winogradskyella psychrotolerans TaxID=1344585 RepID=UPI001C06A857|nr:hypothetical protein [Winogradskyella psychrotolerans]MBU2929707.1 hypothetical protein [Winogradskyella psychrotolerans]
MNKIVSVCFLIGLLGLTTSCSDKNEHGVVGTWLLATRTVDIPFDVNKDGVFNTNLIAEIDCNERETLTFETNGTVSSGNEFSNVLRYFKDDSTNVYSINVDCNKEGIISFASEYSIIEENTIKVSNRIYVLKSDTLTTVYKNAIDIYNEDFTDIIETRDLTQVYTKQ